MLAYLISTHYITVFLILLLSIKLHAQQKVRDMDLRFYWLTLISCLLLVVEDVLERHAAMYPQLRTWRIFLSMTGYTLRPTAAIGLLLVVAPPKFRTWKLWIPWGINLAVNLTAFFSPLAFTFDANYEFVRGPLGYVVFIVSFLYMVMILFLVLRRFYEGKDAERWILILCVLGSFGGSIVDAFYGRVHLTEAVLISSTYLLIYLRSHDNYLDPLTFLRNRFAYYSDAEFLERDVTAVASLDMNGLKRMNDREGHAAGDKALETIGECLAGISGRNVLSYRMGGDEFVVVFLRQREEEVAERMRRLKDSLAAAGCSVSIGCAMKTAGETLEDTLHESDQMMYQDKAAYYQQNGRDRRSRRQE